MSGAIENACKSGSASLLPLPRGEGAMRGHSRQLARTRSDELECTGRRRPAVVGRNQRKARPLASDGRLVDFKQPVSRGRPVDRRGRREHRREVADRAVGGRILREGNHSLRGRRVRHVRAAWVRLRNAAGGAPFPRHLDRPPPVPGHDRIEPYRLEQQHGQPQRAGTEDGEACAHRQKLESGFARLISYPRERAAIISPFTCEGELRGSFALLSPGRLDR
jgi:hypothetical protein